jgi:hypothetical protein
VQGAVHRGAGALEHADHGEWLVVVLDQADGGHAVGQHQFVAELVVQRVGHFGAEHHFERSWRRAGPGQFQVLAAAVLVVLEVVAGGAHHPVAAVRVAQGNRDGPLHPWVLA